MQILTGSHGMHPTSSAGRTKTTACRLLIAARLRRWWRPWPTVRAWSWACREGSLRTRCSAGGRPAPRELCRAASTGARTDGSIPPSSASVWCCMYSLVDLSTQDNYHDVSVLDVCVHVASTERATARVMQEGSAARQIRHEPRPLRHPTASRERRNSKAATPARSRKGQKADREERKREGRQVGGGRR